MITAYEYMKKMNLVKECPKECNEPYDYVTYRSFMKKQYYSSTTGQIRPVNILLPPNYTSKKKYPVLYFLHGIFGNEDSMIVPENGAVYMPVNLAKKNCAKEMIIVCPNIYAQDKPNIEPGFHQDYFHGYNNFIHDLTKDLMPYIEQEYSVARGRDNTALCGFSMGGRTALYIGYTLPQLFGYIGAFSPAPGIVPCEDANAKHIGLFSEEKFRITDSKFTPYVTFISCGTKDSVVGNFPKRYHEILLKNEQPHVWLEVPEADHDDKAIRTGLYHFICAAFGILNS